MGDLPSAFDDHVSGSGDGEMTRREVISNVASRVFFSRAYSFFYGVMIVLNLAALVWALAADGYPESRSFFLLELIISTALILEVGVRILAQGPHFFRSCGNVFDFVVMVLCALTLVLYLSGPSLFEEAEDVVSITLNVFRMVVQFLRLTFLVKHRARKGASRGQVDFTQIAADDDDLEAAFPPMMDGPGPAVVDSDGQPLDVGMPHLSLAATNALHADRVAPGVEHVQLRLEDGLDFDAIDASVLDN